MDQTTFTHRQHLLRLREFCEVLHGILRARSGNAEEAKAVLETAVSAQCVGCGIPVSGKELLALSQPSEENGPKTARMRLGDCARKGCDCFYYEIKFKPYPGIDWSALVEQVISILDCRILEQPPQN